MLGQKIEILLRVRMLLRALAEPNGLEIVRDTYTGGALSLYTRLEALEAALIAEVEEAQRCGSSESQK